MFLNWQKYALKFVKHAELNAESTTTKLYKIAKEYSLAYFFTTY